MKKKLNETDITNELRGASLFFPKSSALDPSPLDAEGETTPPPRRRTPTPKKQPAPKKQPVEQNGVVEPAQVATDFPPGETPSPLLDDDPLIEGIRKAVKRLGKEATFCRFTQEEKNGLGDIVYTYKRNGIRTSENEIVRIAVNWLLENYRTNGQTSVLAQILDSLNN